MRQWVMLKPISILVVLVVFLTGSSTLVRASMIGTADSLSANSAELNRLKLQRLIERTEVRNQLSAWGVQPAEARAVVDNLTDAEVREIAGNMENLPAGGDAVGVIVGAALVVFLVLLITDILGYTNVFPFTK